MDEQGEDAAEFRIAEHPIAGPARLFEVALTDGTVAAVQTDPAAQLVHIEIVTATGSPPARLTIGEREAVATASLLAGLRFAVDGPPSGALAAGPAEVRVVSLEDGDPAVGRRADEFRDADAEVVAVIRDGPDGLLADAHAPWEAGDRLVVVARAGSVEGFVSRLRS
ncbi:hypothetical protein [Agromyces sp. C10]|uniref:hypothetical protein n=1 Tax=Agromyces sp. C10 TaxID=2935077 RepID=UPI00200AF131|nr:hypothetical protein [Agromyces sp. C10]MCK8608148.1 hypothetical protein [Agromyces sp. C10]